MYIKELTFGGVTLGTKEGWIEEAHNVRVCRMAHGGAPGFELGPFIGGVNDGAGVEEVKGATQMSAGLTKAGAIHSNTCIGASKGKGIDHSRRELGGQADQQYASPRAVSCCCVAQRHWQ